MAINIIVNINTKIAIATFEHKSLRGERKGAKIEELKREMKGLFEYYNERAVRIEI